MEITKNLNDVGKGIRKIEFLKMFLSFSPKDVISPLLYELLKLCNEG
jgi:hypothetical protein